jgi:hypothetical protein
MARPTRRFLFPAVTLLLLLASARSAGATGGGTRTEDMGVPAGAAGGPSWVQQHPATSPPARYAHVMAYDPGVRRVIAFGGVGPNGYRNDTWAWDGADWSKLPAAGAPTPRAWAGMAYDRVTHQLVLFGGFDGNEDDYLGDTWTWDDATMRWTGRHPAASPPNGAESMLFTDPVTGHVDAFGGFDGQVYQGQMWTWTGSSWDQLQPAHLPSARGAAIAALDPTRAEVVLFGGLGLDVDTTWTWDGTDWTERSPAHQPLGRYGSAAAFDPRIGGVVLFGGQYGTHHLDDTWWWTGTDWREISPANPPSAREWHGLAFDAARRRLVLFAGKLTGELGRDTWTL